MGGRARGSRCWRRALGLCGRPVRFCLRRSRCGPVSPAHGADGPVRIVAFGDSLTAGYGLPAAAAFPAKLEKALAAKGEAVEISNAGRLRRYRGGRARAPRLVGARGHRSRHPRARRQRHAARPRSAGDAQDPAGHHFAACRSGISRCCCAACWRRPIWAPTMCRRSTASIRICAAADHLSLYPFFLAGWSTTRGSSSATGCTRPPPAST